MPFGWSLLGIGYFAGIKLAGYTLAGSYLNRRVPAGEPRPAVLPFGIVRTLVGVGAGTAYGFAISRVAASPAEGWFYAGLIPLRSLEWLLVLWLFYRVVPRVYTERWGYAGRGVLWSYFLDLPAVIATFALPGGFWIC